MIKYIYDAYIGIESALDALSVGDDLPDGHPEKRRKALYNAFFERELPIMKEEYPGLRLNQYKERIFELWQKSAENPVNQTTAVQPLLKTMDHCLDQEAERA